jgi:DNA-binding winged helix-turn-helix (wHTH) protein
MHSAICGCYIFRMGQVSNPIRVAFGTFEADLSTGELWRGLPDSIQAQPFRLLAELVQRPVQVVTREELQERVWEKETNVDFDHSLGAAINKIREALGDNGDNPRFVETLTRRGYRFIAPVTILDTPPAAPVALTPSATTLPVPHEVQPEPLPAPVIELAPPVQQVGSNGRRWIQWPLVAGLVDSAFS